MSGRLNSQRFDPTRLNIWDFGLVFVDKKLYLYSCPNEIIFTYNVDLSKALRSNTAYAGFTNDLQSCATSIAGNHDVYLNLKRNDNGKIKAIVYDVVVGEAMAYSKTAEVC